jgi:hypothetical protein
MDARIFEELCTIVADRGPISSPEVLRTYECDGLVNFRVLPRAVLLTTSTAQVKFVVRICHRCVSPALSIRYSFRVPKKSFRHLVSAAKGSANTRRTREFPGLAERF